MRTTRSAATPPAPATAAAATTPPITKTRLGAINTMMPNPGNGTNVAGDTPQEVLFIVTDGVADELSPPSCSETETSSRCQEPINTALCTTIKNRGIRIAILYTDYLPVTSNTWYEDWIEPFNTNPPTNSQISTNLQACASPGLFYDAGVDSSNLGADLADAVQYRHGDCASDATESRGRERSTAPRLSPLARRGHPAAPSSFALVGRRLRRRPSTAHSRGRSVLRRLVGSRRDAFCTSPPHPFSLVRSRRAAETRRSEARAVAR